MSALKSGFALDAQGHIPHASVPEVADRHGFIAAWTKRRATSFPNYALPLIAPLVDGRVAILKSVTDGQATVLFAETGTLAHMMPVAELDSLLTNYSAQKRSLWLVLEHDVAFSTVLLRSDGRYGCCKYLNAGHRIFLNECV
jgi:ABC-type bacteriocin/lantibiotic exporter with double-glycine peptidase domain